MSAPASSDGLDTASPSSAATVVLKVQLPHGHKPKMLKYQVTELVWTAKMQLMDLLPDLATSVKDLWNWGLQEDNCEPIRLKALPGMKSATVTKQFLDDGKSFADYGLNGEVSIQFCPRTRITQLTDKEASKINTKKAQKKFMEYLAARNMDKVRETVEKGLDVNFCSEGDNNDSPLVIAVRNDDKNLIKLLIEDGGAHLDYRTPDGKTPLHWAAQLNKFVALRSLLSYGAWHSAPEYPTLATPVHVAASLGHAEIVQHLLSCRASPNPVDRSGKYPLHVACAGSHVGCVQALLQYGADANCVNETRNTPLHVCAANNAIECAKELLKRGANKDQVNRAGQAPHQVAVLATNHDLADVMTKFSGSEAEPYPAPDPKMFADYAQKQSAASVPPSDTATGTIPTAASNASAVLQPMEQLSLNRAGPAPSPPAPLAHTAYDSPPEQLNASLSKQPSMSQYPSISQYPSVSNHGSLHRQGGHALGDLDPSMQLPPPPPLPSFGPPPTLPPPSDESQPAYAGLPPPPPLPELAPSPASTTSLSVNPGLPPPPPLPPAFHSSMGLPPPPPLPVQSISPSPPNGSNTYRHESLSSNTLPPPPPLPSVSTVGMAQRHNSAPPPMSPSSATSGFTASPNYATVSGGTIGASAGAAAAAAVNGTMSMPNLQRVMATFTPEQRKVFKTLLDENKRLQSELERVEAENQQLRRMGQSGGSPAGMNLPQQPQQLQQPITSPPPPPQFASPIQQSAPMMGMNAGMGMAMAGAKPMGMMGGGLPPPPPLPGQPTMQQMGSPQYQSFGPQTPSGVYQQQPQQQQPQLMQQYGSQFNSPYPQQQQQQQQQPMQQYTQSPQQQFVPSPMQQQYGQGQQQQQNYGMAQYQQQQQQPYGTPVGMNGLPPPPMQSAFGAYSLHQGMGM